MSRRASEQEFAKKEEHVKKNTQKEEEREDKNVQKEHTKKNAQRRVRKKKV